MKKTCIIHIGMHKTGSSSVQETLFQNRDYFLQNHDVNYFENRANHNVLVAIFGRHLERFKTLPNLGYTTSQSVAKYQAELRADLIRTASENTSKYFVLSGETLSFLGDDGASRMAEFLQPYFDNIQVWVYVREPFSYASSFGQQLIKDGETFETIRRNTFELDHSLPPLSLPGSAFPYYETRIAPFQRAFGSDNVMIRDFDKSTLYKSDVVLDFLRTCLDADPSRQAYTLLRVNERMSVDAVYLAEALNREVPRYKGNKANPHRALNAIRHLSTIDGESGFTLPEFDFDRFAKFVDNDVEWLKNATSGQIDFTDMKPPARTPLMWTNLSPIAVNLNASQLKDEQNEVSARVFKTLWQCSQDPEAAKTNVNIDRLVARCNDPQLMANFAHNLRGMGLHGLALVAVKRALDLTENASNKELRNRLTHMRDKIAEAA